MGDRQTLSEATLSGRGKLQEGSGRLQHGSVLMAIPLGQRKSSRPDFGRELKPLLRTRRTRSTTSPRGGVAVLPVSRLGEQLDQSCPSRLNNVLLVASLLSPSATFVRNRCSSGPNSMSQTTGLGIDCRRIPVDIPCSVAPIKYRWALSLKLEMCSLASPFATRMRILFLRLGESAVRAETFYRRSALA